MSEKKQITDIWEETNFYGVVDELVDKYSDDEKEESKKRFTNKYGEVFVNTVFNNDDFFTNFVNVIPTEEQEKYINNTIKFSYTNEQYDPNYVIVVRRAVPSYESKPENFWTTNSNEVFNGLTAEIKNEQRLHSVIMVSTLGKLMEHGIVTTDRGVSDGEVAIDPNVPFDNFLFMYKPRNEFYKLVDYVENGGLKREAVLEQLKSTAYERAIKQGLPLKDNKMQQQGHQQPTASSQEETSQTSQKDKKTLWNEQIKKWQDIYAEYREEKGGDVSDDKGGRRLEKLPYGGVVQDNDKKAKSIESSQKENETQQQGHQNTVAPLQAETTEPPQKDRRAMWKEQEKKWQEIGEKHKLLDVAIRNSERAVEDYRIAEQTGYIKGNYMRTKKKEHDMGQSM